jgi:intein/homing endonuclease
MDQYELIASALDLYAEECFKYDMEHDASIWVDSDNADVVRVAAKLFDRINMEEIGSGIVRKMCKYGDHFEAITHNSETGDIIHLKSPPPINVARVQEHGKLLGFKPNISGNTGKTASQISKTQGIQWKPWEIIHFRMPSRERDNLYGDSILYPAATAWEQLKMVEDSLVVYRMTKASDRIIYYVDVGNATPEEAYDIVNRWRKAIKKREYLNRNAGDYRTQWNPVCFVGDTKIALVNGTSITFEEWAKTPDKKLWVYSKDKDGNTVSGLGYHPRTSGEKETCIVTLDNGHTAECTYDHPWMLKDGTYKKAIELEEGNSLAAVYFKTSSKEDGDNLDGYEQIWINEGGYGGSVKGIKEGWGYTHQVIVNRCLGGYGGNGRVAHHKDFDKRNNSPDNLRLMGRVEHIELHAALYEEGLGKWIKENPELHYEKGLGKWVDENPELHKANAARVGKVWRPINLTKYNKSEAHRKVASKTLKKTVTEKWKDPEFREMLRPHQANNGNKHVAVYNKSEKSLRVGKKMANQNFSLYRKWQKFPKEFKKNNPYHVWKSTHKAPNHCVVSVVKTGKSKLVYDITVEEFHNFAIDVSPVSSCGKRSSGVFVHNSIDADLFWPVREGSTSRVEKLSGTPNISDIVDIEYQRNKLFGALRIPKGFMGFEESQGAFSGESTLSSQSIRFASTIKAIRKSYLSGIRRLVAIQLVYKGIDPEDPKNAFKVGMSPISYLDELMRSKVYQLRMDMVQTSMNIGAQSQILDEKRWLTWSLRNFLRLSDDEIHMFLGTMPDIEGPGNIVTPDAHKLVQLVQSNPQRVHNLMEAYLIGKKARTLETYPDNWENNPLPVVVETVTVSDE